MQQFDEHKEVQVIEVIRTTLERRGKGEYPDPIRRVTQYWTLDGQLLAESDPCRTVDIQVQATADPGAAAVTIGAPEATQPAKKRRGRQPGKKPVSIHKVSASDAKIAGMRQELSFAKAQGKLTDAQEKALEGTRNMRVAKMSSEQKAQIISIFEDVEAAKRGT